MKKAFTLLAGAMMLLGTGTSFAAAYPILRPTSVTPAEGSKLEIGDVVEIFFASGQLNLGPLAKGQIVFKEQGGDWSEYYPGESITSEYTSAGTTFFVPFNPEENAPQWVLEVPQKSFLDPDELITNVNFEVAYSGDEEMQKYDKVTIRIESEDMQVETVDIIDGFNIAVLPSTCKPLGDTSNKFYIVDANEESFVAVDVEPIEPLGDEYIYGVYPTRAITKKGTWTFCVGAGAFVSGDGQLKNEAWSHSWEVTGAEDKPEEGDYTGYYTYNSVSPSPNTPLTYEAGQMFMQVTFDLPSRVAVNEAKAAEVTMVAEDGTSYNCTVAFNDAMAEQGFYMANVYFFVNKSGTYTLTVPEGTFVTPDAKANYEWKLTYKVEIAEIGKDIVVNSILPADDATLEGFVADESTIEVEFAAFENGADLEFDVINNTTGENVFSGYMSAPAEGTTYTWVAPASYALYEGTDYTAKFTLYDNGHSVLKVFNVTWHGAAHFEQTWSDTKLVSVLPAINGEMISETDNLISFTFDGPVTVDLPYCYVTSAGQGALKSGKLTLIGGSDKSVVTVSFPEDFMTNPELLVVMYVKGEDGKYVTTQEETEQLFPYTTFIEGKPETGFAILYRVMTGVEVTLDPAAGSEVAKLETVRASYEDMPLRWANTVRLQDVIIYDQFQNPVSVASAYTDEGEVESGEISHYCELTFTPAVTEVGTYRLVLPFGTFAIGEEFETLPYKGQEVTYIVTGEGALDTLNISGAAAAERYYTLQGIRVEKPAKGNAYIRVAGNKAQKVVF